MNDPLYSGRVLSGCAVRAVIQLEDAEDHFHVCGECLHIWMHKQELNQSHNCPKCNAGPFNKGWWSMRSAVDERRQLRAAKARPEPEGNTPAKAEGTRSE